MIGKLKKIYFVLPYLIYTFFILILLMKKTDFHIDELLSYNLSNASEWFTIEDGVRYEPASDIFLQYHTSDGNFDIANVWQQQTNDVHPPFYYLILHAICCLFPGVFSIRFAGMINLGFGILTIAVLRRLTRLLSDDFFTECLVTCSYSFCFAFLNIGTFLRMYVMAGFFVTLFTYILLRNIKQYKWSDFLLLSVIAICGALTHYYFIIYIILLSVVVGIFLLIMKRFGELIKYAVSMAVSGAAVYLIFPAIIHHVFHGGRGTQAFENLHTSDFFSQLKAYFDILSAELFGGLLGAFLTVILLTLIVAIANKEQLIGDLFIKVRYMAVLISCCGFMLLISKTAPYNQDRYISPVFAVCFAAIVSLLVSCIRFFIKSNNKSQSIVCVLIVLSIILGYVTNEWQYLYRERGESIEYASGSGAEVDAIMIYPYMNTIAPVFYEAANLRSITFYNVSNYDDLKEARIGENYSDNVALFLTCLEPKDEAEFVNRFLEDNPEYILIRDNGNVWYTHSFYFLRDGNEG